MNLDYKKKELIREITKTRQFIEYKNAKSNIAKYQNLKFELEAFQKKHMNLFSSNKPDKEKEALALQLEAQYNSLSKIPEVGLLIKTEKTFHDFMFNLYKEINQELDLELQS